MLRIVPHTVPHVGRSYRHFPDGFELHLLPTGGTGFVERLSAVALEFAPDAREDALSAQPEGEGHFEQQLLRCFPGYL